MKSDNQNEKAGIDTSINSQIHKKHGRGLSVLFAACLSMLVIIALTLEGVITASGENATASIYESVVRLHVIANSDSEEDQRVKLAVRDAILAEAGEVFGGSDIEEALIVSASSCDLLTDIAIGVLRANGVTYGAYTVFGKEDYPEREYDGKIYPAGKYYSMRVVLGEGRGRNWWCVLFPPLCLGSAIAVFTRGDNGEVSGSPVKKAKPKFKFKFLEWFR